MLARIAFSRGAFLGEFLRMTFLPLNWMISGVEEVRRSLALEALLWLRCEPSRRGVTAMARQRRELALF